MQQIMQHFNLGDEDFPALTRLDVKRVRLPEKTYDEFHDFPTYLDAQLANHENLLTMSWTHVKVESEDVLVLTKQKKFQ